MWAGDCWGGACVRTGGGGAEGIRVWAEDGVCGDGARVWAGDGGCVDVDGGDSVCLLCASQQWLRSMSRHCSDQDRTCRETSNHVARAHAATLARILVCVGSLFAPRVGCPPTPAHGEQCPRDRTAGGGAHVSFGPCQDPTGGKSDRASQVPKGMTTQKK